MIGASSAVLDPVLVLCLDSALDAASGWAQEGASEDTRFPPIHHSRPGSGSSYGPRSSREGSTRYEEDDDDGGDDGDADDDARARGGGVMDDEDDEVMQMRQMLQRNRLNANQPAHRSSSNGSTLVL